MAPACNAARGSAGADARVYAFQTRDRDPGVGQFGPDGRQPVTTENRLTVFKLFPVR